MLIHKYMGRPSTGAWTVYESLRIDMPYLLKKGYIKKGSQLYFSLNWCDQRDNPTGSITCISSYLNTPENMYLELIYTLKSRSDGTKTDYRYKVYLCEVDSNLGKGKVLYFLCPQSGKKCRILYKAYDSPIFKSRESYNNRLYYDCQQSSKLNKYNDNYWRIDKHLNAIKKEACNGKRTYKGILTKKAQRYKKLSLKQWEMDDLRWTAGVPKALCKAMGIRKISF
ncbi:hypothetical protein FC093_20170 [Ilyomonas limi]|uniref:Uncharacterized protein n=1 Tax=Ilyomonas limi TaxID=2575867 RepID=A0A4U3KUI1_9BACT|nr:hypothetical protein [Ilyomonas limi]TKK65429.1 hypothetical protein FC093_20170 [Ilyomonas limi]